MQNNRKKDYEKKRVKMTVSFNKEIAEDQKRIEFCKRDGFDFSNWVKQKIDEELNEQNN